MSTSRILELAKVVGDVRERLTALEARINSDNIALTRAREAQDAAIMALNAAIETLRRIKGDK